MNPISANTYGPGRPLRLKDAFPLGAEVWVRQRGTVKVGKVVGYRYTRVVVELQCGGGRTVTRGYTRRMLELKP